MIGHFQKYNLQKFPAIRYMFLSDINFCYLVCIDDDCAVSMTTNKEGAERKMITCQDHLEVEFAVTIIKIKQVLCNHDIDLNSVVQQLQTISAVKDKNIQLFDDDVFDKVTTVDKLWQKLSRFWSIFDYDVLIILLQLIKCKKADEILEEFLSRIDISALEDVDLVAHCKKFDREGLMKPLLRIKIKIDYLEKFTNSMKKEAEETVKLKYNLENYSVRFKGIKEGCIELVYEISNAMKLYILQYELTGYDLAEFATHNIISLHINDRKLQIPSEIDMVCSYSSI